MTYRELIEKCFYKLPTDTCMSCKYQKECYAFENKIKVGFPGMLHQVLNVDLDTEIEVVE